MIPKKLAAAGLLAFAGAAQAQAPAMSAAPVTIPSVVTTAPTAGTAVDTAPGGGYENVWVAGEYLFWTPKKQTTPPLASFSPDGTPLRNAGVLGTPGATTVFGNDGLNGGLQSGFRLRAGFWLDGIGMGLDSSMFFLGNNTDGGTFGSSTGSPIISRPFVNAVTGRNDAELVSFPGVLTGTVSVGSNSNVVGGDVNLRRGLICDPCNRFRLDAVAGYRPFRLTDEITMVEDLTTGPDRADVPTGSRILVRDRFRTENTFHGGQLGLAGFCRSGRWSVDGRALVALGQVSRRTTIEGDTTVTLPNGTRTVRPGGLLAQPSNIGTYESTGFAVAPEVAFTLGYQLNDCVRLTAGYTFFYINNVARAGTAIDPVVNPLFLNGTPNPNPARPAFLNETTDFWLHGASVGVVLTY